MKNHYPNSDFKVDTYYKNPSFKHMLYTAYNAGKEVYVNTVRRLNNCSYARKLRGEIKIRDIFDFGWKDFLTKYESRLQRPGLIRNIERSIKCGRFENGFALFECSRKDCINYTIVPFTCKSRFCSSCGKKYRDARSYEISRTLIDVPHRQFVFSIPHQLRDLYRKYRGLLNVLFDSVKSAFEETLFAKAPIAAKKENRQLGFHSFLHTFGRDLKWHPHLHVLIAEAYMKNDGSLHHISYFPFDAIRLRFKYLILNNTYRWLRENCPKELSSYIPLQRLLNMKYKKGFYVYGPQMKNHRLKNMRSLTKYVARYASHPPISESRIENFDSTNGYITWYYDPHEDDTCEEKDKKGRQHITETVESFISKLIIHIPDENFHQIRHYGFYSNKTKTRPHHKKMSTEDENRELRKLLRWENLLMATFGFTPLLCECGCRMFINHQLSYYPRMDNEEWQNST